MTELTDTIAAVATPAGRGGIGIIRISGPRAAAIARGMLGMLPPPRHASYLPFRGHDDAPIDHGLALYFPAPHSYTGEDVLELHGHGGPVVLDMLLERALALGARHARSGEFTERAYLNDKLDLAQAEAVADLIASGSRSAARAALRALDGALSDRIRALVQRLTWLRTCVEASIDFPEDDIDPLQDEQLRQTLDEADNALQQLRQGARQGRLLRDGIKVVIAGRPNAGKSSLLNALAERDCAIVTPVAGTTRDLVREYLHIDGIPLHIVDTAGLREGVDPVEQAGIARARAEMAQADRILLVRDDTAPWGSEDEALLTAMPASVPVTVVHNKIDLSGRQAGPRPHGGRDGYSVSATGGTGLEVLKRHLVGTASGAMTTEGVFVARRRHLDALDAAAGCFRQARSHLYQNRNELFAEELRLAQRHLGTITGEVTPDELLGKIFAEFCIGK
ncbi:MAG TPA: tRNA uridine-5-carboxymethylaminomethyl(34) synthesis GTPase MnmE [Gammaproteobacteria bacterium]|nr:tRNA uridine-5-carboxymethylaminomethyl(34) synthesis GTPase MnmE [Gammaproteobacteria bacterium]